MDTPTYQTHDLPEATFLTCCGHRPSVIPGDRPDRAVFRFPKTEQLDADLSSLASGEGKVSPPTYEHVRRTLLDRVRAVLREGGRR